MAPKCVDEREEMEGNSDGDDDGDEDDGHDCAEGQRQGRQPDHEEEEEEEDGEEEEEALDYENDSADELERDNQQEVQVADEGDGPNIGPDLADSSGRERLIYETRGSGFYGTESAPIDASEPSGGAQEEEFHQNTSSREECRLTIGDGEPEDDYQAEREYFSDPDYHDERPGKSGLSHKQPASFDSPLPAGPHNCGRAEAESECLREAGPAEQLSPSSGETRETSAADADQEQEPPQGAGEQLHSGGQMNASGPQPGALFDLELRLAEDENEAEDAPSSGRKHLGWPEAGTGLATREAVGAADPFTQSARVNRMTDLTPTDRSAREIGLGGTHLPSIGAPRPSSARDGPQEIQPDSDRQLAGAKEQQDRREALMELTGDYCDELVASLAGEALSQVQRALDLGQTGQVDMRIAPETQAGRSQEAPGADNPPDARRFPCELRAREQSDEQATGAGSTGRRHLYASSLFYDDKRGSYPTLEEQVAKCQTIAKQLAVAMEPIETGAGHFAGQASSERASRMFKRRRDRMRHFTVSSCSSLELAPDVKRPAGLERAQSIAEAGQAWPAILAGARYRPYLDATALKDIERLRAWSARADFNEHGGVSPEVCQRLAAQLRGEGELAAGGHEGGAACRGSRMFGLRRMQSSDWIVAGAEDPAGEAGCAGPARAAQWRPTTEGSPAGSHQPGQPEASSGRHLSRPAMGGEETMMATESDCQEQLVELAPVFLSHSRPQLELAKVTRTPSFSVSSRRIVECDSERSISRSSLASSSSSGRPSDEANSGPSSSRHQQLAEVTSSQAFNRSAPPATYEMGPAATREAPDSPRKASQGLDELRPVSLMSDIYHLDEHYHQPDDVFVEHRASVASKAWPIPQAGRLHQATLMGSAERPARVQYARESCQPAGNERSQTPIANLSVQMTPARICMDPAGRATGK